ncbi:dna-directed rna polymerases i and iii 40 kda polypeptide [Diaporthe eres]|uniref:DNA-directed RNA polymerase RpoA/D/Rpb3-type domain-containing protein n=1 Tax=Diaporthe vaccinii TaxID=105482 RepID=A0ABR4EPU3_9PEZI|nr:dna-directed rna polymerases i and iii 40 kda polypeptide [Diaporthe eres]
MAPIVVPTQEELDRRKVVNINAETVTNVTSTDFPGHYPGEDNSWDLEAFRQQFKVLFHENGQHDASFSLVGLDASIANAFRRIMIAEIPTLAIEDIWVNNNTSVIQDEVLCHRLGLVPFKGGKYGLHDFMKWYKKPGADQDPFENSMDYNTVKIELDVQCTRRDDAEPGEKDPRKLFNHANVYASDLKFLPVGQQAEVFAGDQAIAPVHPDILVAKLRPGQQIQLMAHMHKGIGADHAKFSPVATASYRLLPLITITRPIVGADADKFQRCFPEGVIGLQKVTKQDAKANAELKGHEGEMQAVVKDSMKDTVSRECLRHPEFVDKVKLGRQRDHFIFQVESSGQWDSDELFLEAVKHLKAKCQRFEKQVTYMAM